MGRKVWLVLLVLTVPLVNRVLRDYLEQRARPVRVVRAGHREPLWQDRLAHPAYQGPRVIPDRQVPRAHRVR